MSVELDIHKENFEEAKRQVQLIMGDREFATLEELLHRGSQALASLQRSRRELDFGKTNRTLVNELFPVIKEEVDKFFGVENISELNIQYRPMQGISIVYYAIGGVMALGVAREIVTNGVSDPVPWIFMGVAGVFVFLGKFANYMINKDDYDPVTRTIRVMGKTKAKVVSSLGHEYAHHIQLINSLKEGYVKKFHFSTFDEGVARAVQRHVCKLYAERETNEEYNFDILNETVCELKSMYSWICEITGKPIKDNLLKVRTTLDKNDRCWMNKYGYPTQHAVGNAIYYVFKTLGRDKECQAMRNNTFDF